MRSNDAEKAEETASTMFRNVRARTHLSALAIYTLLALILTWPLVTKITTHVPGIAQWAFDESTFVWNIWYFKHALIDNLSNPLHSELIWYPLGIDLILYTYNFFHALIAQPLMLAANLPAASNIALLLSTVLSAYGTFLLVHYLLADLAHPQYVSARNRVITAQPRLGSSFRTSHRSQAAAALLAGAIYAFGSNRAIYAALGHYDMVTTQWIPFYALMLLRMLDGRLSANTRRKAALLAGVFFAFNGLAEMITAVFLAIFTLIVLLDYLLRRRKQTAVSQDTGDNRAERQSVWLPAPNLRSSLFNFVILGVMAFLLWAPALVPILVQFLTDDFALKGWGEAIPLSTDLLGWFTPTVLHPLFGGELIAELRRVQFRALEMGVTGFRDVNTVFIGWTTVALALLGAFTYRRRVRLWIWTAVIFGLFTLGPFLQINGEYRFDLDGIEATVPLPFALLHYIPIVKANRAPNRNSVLLMLAVAVLAGYGAWWIMRKLNVRRAQRTSSNVRSSAFNLCYLVALGLTVLILFEHLAVPAPLSDARVPAVYAQIAADPGRVSILQVPLGWRNSFGVLGSERTQLQYYQTAHGKPMLGGNISRAPDFKMEYFARIPYFDALTRIEFGLPVEQATLDAASAQAAELMYLYNTAYVLLYPPIPQRFPYADHWETTWDFVKTTLPLEREPLWSEDGIEAYRVVQPDGADSFRLDLGKAGTFPYRGEGWDDAAVDTPYETSAIWALGNQSRLFVPLRNIDPNRDYTLTLHARPFAYPGSPRQSVQATVNGFPMNTIPLTDEWQEVSWRLPGVELVDGLNRVAFTWGNAASPRTVVGGSRDIGTTGVALPVDADLKAFIDGAFIALFDETGQQINASAGRRGVNVTVLDEQTGRLLDKTGFDTAANAYESQALVDYLATIEPGRIVLVATQGDATAFLSEAAVEAFGSLGADLTLGQVKGQYVALIGVQGAVPATAAQSIDPVEAFLTIGLNRDRRPLSAAVDWVAVE